MGEITTKILAFEKELDKELTNKQQQERTLDEDIKTKDRRVANLDKIILFLDGKIKEFDSKIERASLEIPKLKEIIRRNANCPILVGRLTRKIKSLEALIALKRKLKIMTEQEMDKKIDERDALESIELMGPEAQKELDEEIQGQKDGNVGFAVTGEDQGNETVSVLSDEMLMPTFMN